MPPLQIDGATIVEELLVKSDDDVVAVQVDIAFDPAQTTLTSISKGGAASGHSLAQKEMAPGLLRAVLTSPTSAVFGDGALLRIEFESSVALVPSDRVFSLTNVEFSTLRAQGVTAALAPYVEIAAPGDGSAHPALQDIAITAVSVATQGDVDRVEFFAGDLRIGVATTAPYSVNYFPTALGTGVITAVAIGDLGGRGEDTVSLDITGTPYYEVWRTSQFTPAQLADDSVSSPTADPDGDRVPNLMEYYLGLDPNGAESTSSRVAYGKVEHEGETFLALTLRKPIAVNDLAADVESSGDLRFGGVGRAVLHARSIEGADEVLVYRDTIPVDEAARRFLRANFQFYP